MNEITTSVEPPQPGKCPTGFRGRDESTEATKLRNDEAQNPDASRSSAKDYGIALLAVALAFLVRWILWPVIGSEFPYVLNWPAIVFAAWYGGFWSGVLATVLSALGTVFFLMEPRFSLTIARGTEQFGFSFFLLLGVGFSLFVDWARNSERARLTACMEARYSQATSEYYRNLIEVNLDPMVIESPDGKITDVNAAAENVTGRTRKELIGTEFPDYFTEPDKARQLYQQVHRDGWVRDYPLEIRNREGHTTPVLYNAAVYRDKDGGILGVVATVRDISERIKAEKAIKESLTAFRILAESVPQLVWMCQPDGLNIYFNQRWVEYTGLTLEESYGRGWNTPFHLDDKQPAWNAWNQAVSTGGEYRIECRLRAADGGYRWFLIKGVPLHDAMGTIVKWFGTCTDIDDLKRSQEGLHGLNKELEQRVQERTSDLEASNKELEAFAYSVSHDLRSPLRAIDGFSQILLKEYLNSLPEKPQHYLQVVCDNARQMGRLIDDLLRFSRSSRQSIQAQVVHPREIVDHCLEDLQPEREGRQVEIQIGELPECWADGSLLKQVWFNLLANALKYSRKRDPSRIEIGSDIKDGETVYFVRDNGVGFDMQYAQKLFGVFQRLHAAEDYEGTGIGLALVQRILHRHGGRIWADAKVDQGATFYFTLGRRTPHA